MMKKSKPQLMKGRVALTYAESLQYLNELAKFGIKPGLERILSLLRRLGNPQNKYKTIHITGTNGKGSVTAMLSSILSESGCSTGAFTSPHLFRYTERMTIDGEEISEDEFAAAANSVRASVEAMLEENEECPTQFEFLTAMAFYYFAKKNVDYAVIEVGLGGLLDSTNVIVPEVAAITNVTLEHADKCGGTLEGIARHKAGIIKAGVPVVTGAEGAAVDIIAKRADELDSRLYLNNREFKVQNSAGTEADDGQTLLFSDMTGCRIAYHLKMIAEYQMKNSAVAIMTAKLISGNDGRVTDLSIQKGLEKSFWPGRFEIFSIGNDKIVIDGAHNPAGIAALRKSLDITFPRAKRLFLLGILRDKAVSSMIKILLRPEDRVVVTSPDSDRAATPEEIVERIHDSEVIAVSGDRKKALDIALNEQGSGELLVITGSLYLIGYIRQLLIEKLGTNR
ncbi:MAG: folylpolyglutamate synthase/dihydrofolate synthase family protein [Selenomonadaceae bacterium]|nr:folylpolyglutamate synthase/dihydrofolate synthase family protein [Selenomonadaceae bacterium]